MSYFESLSRYDSVAAVLQSLLVIGALGTALVYLAKRSGNRSSNVFFALLLSTFALNITSLVLEHLGLPARQARFRYIPLWFTWTIGPAWFYYVKFSLFPAYRFRWTDLKHFVFPLLQVIYYVFSFVFSTHHDIDDRRIFGIRHTTLEEAIFLLSVGGYLFAGYRYLRFRARAIGNNNLRWDYWKVKLLRRSQRVIFVLLSFNFVFVFYNFAQTQFVGTSLLHLRSFYASSSLSFGLILLYLLRGVAYRQHFYPQVPARLLSQKHATIPARFKELIETQQGFKDPDLHKVRTARALGVAPDALEALAIQRGHRSWWDYICRLRFAEISRLRQNGLSLKVAALEVGFGSLKWVLKVFRER